jgi:hypothetical protein
MNGRATPVEGVFPRWSPVKNCQVLDFESGSGVAKYSILLEIAVLEGIPCK